MTLPSDLPAHLRREVLNDLESDIRSHANGTDQIHSYMLTEHRRAKDAERTALEFSAWQDEQITLSAVAWVLGCVFVRFCEDNHLIAEPYLAGPGERLSFAEDQTASYFERNPTHSDREYLLWVFGEVSKLPGMAALFDPAHNPLYKLPPSVDGAKALLRFWRERDPNTGELALSFEHPARDTRFLGDLYQDLSEEAKKRYALLQTPEFIESFILDRALEPAIREFGLANTDLIDPACGSGHFLLGAFERLLSHWQEKEPQTNVRVLCQRALEQIAGVDINPFAVAIARFRLLVAALNASEVKALKDAPDFKERLATGDSLLHGQRPGRIPGTERASARPEHQHLYDAEDEQALRKILDRRYAAVVANPPYIIPRDPAANQAYRDRFEACYRQYALSVPFMERLFDLARPSDGRSPAGFIGQITSNSFMKREFGKKLVEDYLPNWGLTHLIDTSGTYIPGHGTPTVILLARAQSPKAPTVRGVLGIRGEPSTPADPAKGKVWTEIIELVDQPGAEGEFVSTEDLDRDRLAKHPWSLQGGGAGEVQSQITGKNPLLHQRIHEIGFSVVTREDDVYWIGRGAALRNRVPAVFVKALVGGDNLRDWQSTDIRDAAWPYLDDTLQATDNIPVKRFLWRWRTQLSDRVAYGKTQLQRGREWFEYSMFFIERYRIKLSIAYGEIASHNHFVLDRGGTVFNRTAPVIKLPDGSSEVAHLQILGLLNSSTALFWGRQVFYPKGGYGGGQWENRLAWDASKLRRFPLPKDPPTELARRLDTLGQEISRLLPTSLFEGRHPAREFLDQAGEDWKQTRHRMIALQEELDWRCYRLYGLIEEDLIYPDWDALPEVELGERVFEIALSRRVAAGETETRWFERHGSTPVTEIPAHFPDDYQELLQRRLDAIEANKAVRLIERPEYKRRWQTRASKTEDEAWAEMEQEALREWICDRLEAKEIWGEPKLLRSDQVADLLLTDQAFQEAIRLYGGPDAEAPKMVAKLMAEEAVPFLASLRYTEGGMRKREAWERIWELQRAEDRGEKVEIDLPPKYKQADFRSQNFWRQRGKLDVPKERFISYPGAGKGEADLYGWAGWDHLERAQALATQITIAQDREGAPNELVAQLLAGLKELLPWVYQWHPEWPPEVAGQYGSTPGEVYEGFLEDRSKRTGPEATEVVA